MDLDLSLLPQAAAQMRGALSSLYFAAARLAPSAAREQDPELERPENRAVRDRVRQMFSETPDIFN